MNTLVGFGASSMQGVGDSEGGFLRRVDLQCQVRGFPLKVVNKGIGGQSTPAMLARMDELAALRPYGLVLLLGCNDLPRARDGHPAARTSLAVYTANLARLLPAIRGERSFFISSFAVSEERTGIAPGIFADYLGAATELARACDYEVWDLYSETRDSGAALLAADGLHFNDTGHALIAARVCDWLAAAPQPRRPAC